MLSKRPLTDVKIGFPDLPLDEQKRLMAATIDGVRVINVYMPNGQSVGSEKFIYKLGFIARLRTYLDQCHKPEEPLVMVGDFNVAPEPIDVHDPAAWVGRSSSIPKRGRRWRISNRGDWKISSGSITRRRGCTVGGIIGSPPSAGTSVFGSITSGEHPLWRRGAVRARSIKIPAPKSDRRTTRR